MGFLQNERRVDINSTPPCPLFARCSNRVARRRALRCSVRFGEGRGYPRTTAVSSSGTATERRDRGVFSGSTVLQEHRLEGLESA